MYDIFRSSRPRFVSIEVRASEHSILSASRVDAAVSRKRNEIDVVGRQEKGLAKEEMNGFAFHHRLQATVISTSAFEVRAIAHNAQERLWSRIIYHNVADGCGESLNVLGKVVVLLILRLQSYPIRRSEVRLVDCF